MAAGENGTDENGLTDESEAVFSVLGDETRLEILLELASRAKPEQASQETPFSELRRAVGVDDAGRFNYHLDKLQDTFVVKDEDGYRPTVAGLEVASSIHAGRYARDTDELVEETTYDCPTCGAVLEVSFENEVVLLRCVNDHQWFSFPVPAGAAVGRSPEALLDVAIRRASVNIELARNDLCPRCWGSTTIEIEPAEGEFDGLADDLPKATVECDRCWLSYYLPAPQVVGRAPPVVAFFHEHGLAPEEAVLSDRNVLSATTVTTTDGTEAAIEFTITLGGEELHVELADDGELLEYERVA